MIRMVSKNTGGFSYCTKKSNVMILILIIIVIIIITPQNSQQNRHFIFTSNKLSAIR